MKKNKKAMVPAYKLGKVFTSCCALNQLTASNNVPFEALQEFVNTAIKESIHDWSAYGQGGAKALFCMTVYPVELGLENKLQQLGFQLVKERLNRRNGERYVGGHINMWLLNW